MLTDRICQQCGKSFRGRDDRPGKFCSWLCQRKGRIKRTRNDVILYCVICGEKFRVKPYRKDTAITCSKQCQHKWLEKLLKKEIVVRNDWDDSNQRKTWTRKVKERANYICQQCGYSASLEAHHLLGVTDFPGLANELWNGVALCHGCHMEEHYGEKGEKLDKICDKKAWSTAEIDGNQERG